MARRTVDRSADGSACDSRSGHPLGHTGSPGRRAHRGHDELHEFYVKVARKIRALLSKVKARNVVGTYLVWCLEPETGDIHEAFRIEDEASIKFLGCLIVAAAARSGARRVLSEDLNPWRDYSALEIRNGDLFGNAERAARFEWDFRRNRIAQPVDKAEWSMTPQTVNAYYSPVKNEIVFPAAILQPPFFDPKADPAVNYVEAVGELVADDAADGAVCAAHPHA